MPTNRSVRGGPTFSARGNVRPSASVAGHGVPGLMAARLVAAVASHQAAINRTGKTEFIVRERINLLVLIASAAGHLGELSGSL